ncbi:hypothetical protein K440DRAFT_517209, partial [Wilcoxina mikolae CBS 423.85]
VAAAGAGDDFSNNLLTDLAPLVTPPSGNLFGEQVAKQFLSQSMGWVDSIIFAMAPLGIITGIVSAIRVGGPSWLKAVIGHAREGTGVVEVELMSSTSDDVCELWNGKGIVRILGRSDVLELIYIKSLDEVPAGSGIYDFREAMRKGILKRTTPGRSEDQLENLPLDSSPNVSLNVGGQRVSDIELKIVAVVGTLLQGGVVAFAGVAVLHPRWSTMFSKHDQLTVAPFAFPTMAVGTFALVVGMFLCAHIVDGSTVEDRWEITDPRANLAWLQKGGKINDQQFESNNRPFIITSRKDFGAHPEKLTVLATAISLCGFAVMFLGLRGLHWSVTMAQLSTTAIMAGFRALVRRNMVHEPDYAKIDDGYELEWMS